jgi:lipopolysaccharide export system protein LptA
MTSDDNTRIVTFTGRVITRQDDLIITCDQMRVHYQPIGGPAGGPEEASGDAVQSGAANAPQGSAQRVTANAPMATNNPNDPMALENRQNDLNAAGAAPPLPPSVKSEPSPPPQNETPGPLQSGQEIYRIECEGSVKIQQRDRLAVGQKALYLAKSEPRRLILTGDARVWEAGNSVTGHQVIYYLDQNRSQVESRQNQRVRAFYDDGSNQ